MRSERMGFCLYACRHKQHQHTELAQKAQQLGAAYHGTATNLSFLPGLANLLEEGKVPQVRSNLGDGSAETSNSVGHKAVDLASAGQTVSDCSTGFPSARVLTMSGSRSSANVSSPIQPDEFIMDGTHIVALFEASLLAQKLVQLVTLGVVALKAESVSTCPVH